MNGCGKRVNLFILAEISEELHHVKNKKKKMEKKRKHWIPYENGFDTMLRFVYV
jgi:hypothetical protein